MRDRKLVNAKTGEPFEVELLVEDPSFERFMLFYKPVAGAAGHHRQRAHHRSAQYENRLRSWDFDIVVASWGESLSPGNEQREYWGSQAADSRARATSSASRIPAIDKLIERVIYTKDRDDLVAATKALDRVLLWNHYVVPQWNYRRSRTARWDRFGRPSELPKYGLSAFPALWWFDADRAAKIGKRS